MKKYGFLRFKAPNYFYLYTGDVSVGDVVGPASATNNAIVRFNGTTGKLIQDTSQVTIDANGVLTLTGTTENIMTLTSNFGVGASSNLLYIEATNANYNRPLLRIVDSSTDGGAANIRIDSPNPDIEFVETDQATPAGKFEIAVQNDKFQFNGRNTADTAFEQIFNLQRFAAGGQMGLGVATGDVPNAKLEIVTTGSFAYLMCSGAVGGSSGDIFSIDTSGNFILNDRGNAISLRMEGDTDANLFFVDGTNDKVNIGFNTAGNSKFNVKGEVQFGVASTTTGRVRLAKSTGAGITIFEPGSIGGSDITITLPIVTGTVALTTGNTSIASSRFVGNSSTPGIAAGTGAGTSPTVSVTGNDAAMLVNITTGTTPAGTNAIVATITFNTTYAAAPRVSITPGNRAAAGLTGTNMVLIPAAGQTNGVTTTTFVIESGTVALAGSTAYIYNVLVIG